MNELAAWSSALVQAQATVLVQAPAQVQTQSQAQDPANGTWDGDGGSGAAGGRVRSATGCVVTGGMAIGDGNVSK